MVLLFIMKIEPHLTRHLQKILNMKEIPEQADKKGKENPGKRQKAKSQLNKEYQYTTKRILIRLSMQRASLVAQMPLQRLRRSPTLGIGVRNGTCHP